MTDIRNDKPAILDTIRLYTDGWNGNSGMFRDAFDPEAWIYFIDENGVRHRSLLTDLFDGWAATGWEIEGNILDLEKFGDIAYVRLGFNNLTRPSASYIDLLSLVKFDDRWRIVSKTAIHLSQVNS